ncbi:MAG: radical SAM family heme chaperone HemW [Deltaproteobacteria bacterium]|nr:radical SAM family heme chaperone HemW [Deltaproteobacteria bacterium]
MSGRFSLYVHVPYCQAKCPYCDFNSYAATRWPEDAYADALLAELRRRAAEPPFAGAAVATIFFGGGTPSLFRPRTIERLLTGIATTCPVAADAEITLEANPGTVERGRLADFRGAGVRRLSFGIQSFQPDLLTTLGRIHDPDEARAAIDAARAAGFDELNLDLIFAVPGETRAQWEADVAEIVRFAPEHVSAYNLTYEPGTPFHTLRARGALTPLDDEDELWMYQHARRAFAAAGYAQYEISSFARPGHEARHNQSYWRGVDYLGLGAGAHSYARHPAWGRRWSNERIPERYIAAVDRGDPTASAETLTFDTAAAEFVFLGLREMRGIEPAAFAARFGTPLEEIHPEIAGLRADGLLVDHGGRVVLSERGLLLADSIFARLM